MTRRSLLMSAVAMALRKEKVDEAVALIQSQVDSGSVRAASLHVCQGKQIVDRAFGAAKTPAAVFLLASISKPMTASAVMLLSDRKQLSIEDPVNKFIPEFRGGEKDRILLRHLLTHTSGLPDMLPENDALRKRHAPLKDFVAATCATPLLFSPGTSVKYQSMGVLLAAEIVERVSKRSLPEFLRDEIYRPLGMKDTSLGLGGRDLNETMQCQVERAKRLGLELRLLAQPRLSLGRRACNRRRCRPLPALLRRTQPARPETGHRCRHDHRPESRPEHAVGNRLDAVARHGQTLVAPNLRAQRLHRHHFLAGSRKRASALCCSPPSPRRFPTARCSRPSPT